MEKTTRDSAIKNQLREGETLFSEGKIEEAERCFLDLLENNPSNSEILNNVGVIHYTRGNFGEAEAFFFKALATENDYQETFINLANLYENSKRWDEAARYLEKYISKSDQDPDLFNQLGMVYLETGDVGNACAALQKSLELNPDQESVIESLKLLQKSNSAPDYLPTPGSFRGAFAEINITPNVSEQNPVFLQGMLGPPRKATAVSEPLMMQLLLLEDDHFTKVLFVTADLFGFGPEVVNSVQALVAQWGIEPEGLILNASHTHYAPGTISHASKLIGTFNDDYTKQIVQAIANHLPMLYDRLEECEIGWSKTDAQIGVGRRLNQDGKIIFAPNSEGYYDKDTPFILLHLLKTDKKVLLVNHGCHPTGLGYENVISADYPGYMRNALKSNEVVDGVMFLQGGAGSTKESVCINGEVRFCENFEEVKENGEFLATQIMNGLEENLQPVKGSFFCTRSRVLVPLKPLPPAEVLSQTRNDQEIDELVREWASSLLNRFPNGDFPARVAMEIQLISLGDKVSFVTLPGEPVAELARDLRKLTNNPDSTFVLGYTNGLIGYLPTDTMIEEGGYETEISPFSYHLPSGPGTGTELAIISATQKCIGASAEIETLNGYGRYHLAKESQKAFFVLSAGRCGTMTLAHLLNTSTNARVWHHPQPDLIRESLLAYWGEIERRTVFWKARYAILHKTWSEGLIHGETDLLMTPFCDMLANEIPDSKFIVLVRDPRDFVRSGMRRNYYNGHPWDFGRLRPKEGTGQYEAWNELNQFERICWLWAETYQQILEIALKIREKSVMVVRFEDLVADERKTEELFAFLDLDGYSLEAARKVLAQRFNAQKGGAYPAPEQWEQAQRDRLWQICGKVASELGYSAEPDYTTAGRRGAGTVTAGSWLDLLRRQHPTEPMTNISVKQAGTAKNGLPFVQAENGLRFFGLPKNHEYDQAFNQIPPAKRGNMDRDTFAIMSDIVNRHAKQKQHLRYAYKPGDTVVELGAFLGYYAMYAAKQVGPEGKVVAVEALPSLHKVLEQNLQTNFPDRAVAVCQGVGARKGNAIFFTGGNQKNGMRKDVIEQYCEQTDEVNVEIDTIDNLLAAQKLNAVDLLIVQLNGVELKTLSGIESSWDNIRNFAIAANYDQGGLSAPTEIANLLQSKGFVTEIFNRWVYAKRPPASAQKHEPQSKGPIFVGGCGRSGTTLLRVMLDSLPNVAAGPESELLIDPGKLSPSRLAFRFDLNERELLQIADQSAYLPDFMQRLMSAYAAKQGKNRWAEKTPKNVHRIQYIFDNFPDAWFVHLIRDGRDTICSLRTHPRYVQKNGEWVESGFRRPIQQCITRWVNDVSAGIACRHHERYIELKYEDLVVSPEETMRELLTKIGEPWDPAVLAFHEQRTSSRDHRKFPQNREATKPLSRESVGKWHQELSRAEIQQVKQIAGPLLIETGYCQDLNW